MERDKYHAKKPDYMLGERNLDIEADMDFINSIFKDQKLEAEPGVRGLVLDIAYTLARDKLVEANRFSKLANRTNLTVDDLEMAHMEETDELKNCLQTLKNMDLAQEVLPKPCMEKGLMLPNWRNCQVGVMPELVDSAEVKPATKVIHARPMIRRAGVPRPHAIQPVSNLANNGAADHPVIASTSKGSLGTQGTPLRPSTELPFAKRPRPN